MLVVLLLIAVLVFASARNGDGWAQAVYALTGKACRRRVVASPADVNQALVRKVFKVTADALRRQGVTVETRNGVPYPTAASLEALGPNTVGNNAAVMQDMSRYMFLQLASPECLAAITVGEGSPRNWETVWPGDSQQFVTELETSINAMLEAVGRVRVPAAALPPWRMAA